MDPNGNASSSQASNSSSVNGNNDQEFVDRMRYIDEAHENGHSSGGDAASANSDGVGASVAGVAANMRGSQLSIGQISNMASSGYQSFAYESSSPVDPAIGENGGHAALHTNG
jgi:hypothetical protein